MKSLQDCSTRDECSLETQLTFDAPEAILASQGDEERKDREKAILQIIMFGANGFFLGAHRLLNGKYLVALGSAGSAASSLVLTSQTLVLGTALGSLLGTGLSFGSAVGRREYKTAGDIAKSATILSIIIGAASTGALLATKKIFPLLFEQEVAEIVSDFFHGYAASCIPQLFLVVGSQIAFQHGDWYVPPLSTFLLLSGAGGASYLLGFKANLGAFGIGLGGTIGSLFSAISLGVLFMGKSYKKYELYTCRISKFSEKTKNLANAGWKLALQRFTEWGNLLTITTAIGINSNVNLAAANPGMLYLNVAHPLLQNFAHSVGMIISKNKGAMQIAKQINDDIGVLRTTPGKVPKFLWYPRDLN